MSWKRHSDGGFFLALASGEIVANVYLGTDRLGREAWIWEGHLPSDAFMDITMDGWHGSTATESGAKEAAERYLRRHGVLVS